ncbi:hypothetical protein CRUP_010368 [Coryphaenoides rupestris]|nr:hypothetical protein CRUP_010368 [Coryphaenoides rupestris]
MWHMGIILGSLYHADHLSRAMYQRISEIEELPAQFSLNRPLLSGQYLPRPDERSTENTDGMGSDRKAGVEH